MRISKENYYLDIAETCASRGTCLRRNYGAVIVNNDHIVGTGYTGSPRGDINCCNYGKCLREELNVKCGTRYELCRSVHAEMNACLHAGRANTIEAILYLCGLVKSDGSIFSETYPCLLCKRIIVNAGIKELLIRRTKTTWDRYQINKDYIKGDLK